MAGPQLRALALVPRIASVIAAWCCVAGSPAASFPAAYTSAQLANAQAIVNVASAMHLGQQAAVLGVTAALGESDLENIDCGDDAINPDGTVADSVGLFQQQRWWGTLAQRLNPTEATTSFYLGLEAVPDWNTLAPTVAIHDVQGNADPNYYAQYYRPALLLTEALSRVRSADSSVAQPAFAPVAVRTMPSSSPTPTSSPITFDDINADMSSSVLSALAAQTDGG